MSILINASESICRKDELKSHVFSHCKETQTCFPIQELGIFLKLKEPCRFFSVNKFNLIYRILQTFSILKILRVLLG